MNYQFIVFTLFIYLISCDSVEKINSQTKEGIVLLETHFYDTDGKPTFTDLLRIWYRDSNVIEEIHRTNTVTDNTTGITRVSYPVILYRHIDLRSKVFYDYKSFSDSDKIFNKAVLPDSLMRDYGWSFYSEKTPKIQGIPEPLSDTVIDNITYKRAKLNFIGYDPKNSFLIGYFRCDGKGDMFSLEKVYSRSINCAMVKFFDYKINVARPFASKEVNYISDTLSKEELKVFDAWEKNARNNPVQK